ncbi:MAG: hypothetical protein IT442_02130 [Phycisphaeraceae bacterium]|nr:hypothetical protein [Phycisphaeraceae bacterium]
MNAKSWITVCAAGLFAVSASGALVGTVATFDSDEEGWVGGTTSTVQVYAASGGNPGGHVEIRKDLTPPVYDIGTRNSVTPGFLGDYAAAGVTGAGYDLNVFNSTADHAYLRFRRGVDENGWRYDFGLISPNGNAWVPLDVAFDPTWDDLTARANGWLTDDDIDAAADPSPAFASVMADVGWIEARIASEGSTIVGIDNVRLVPEPAALTMLALGGLLITRRRIA